MSPMGPVADYQYTDYESRSENLEIDVSDWPLSVQIAAGVFSGLLSFGLLVALVIPIYARASDGQFAVDSRKMSGVAFLLGLFAFFIAYGRDLRAMPESWQYTQVIVHGLFAFFSFSVFGALLKTRVDITLFTSTCILIIVGMAIYTGGVAVRGARYLADGSWFFWLYG